MKQYNIFYTDSSFMSVEMSEDDFKKLADALVTQNSHVALTNSVLALGDIRMVVERKEPEQSPQTERPILPVLDVESEEFLKSTLGKIWSEGVY